MSIVEVPFEVVVSRALGTVVVTIHGELDTYTAPQLRNQLKDLIDEQGNLTVVVDLGKMSFIDSSGLAVLVDALKRMRRHRGSLTLANPSRSTSKVFEISGLNRIFTVS